MAPVADTLDPIPVASVHWRRSYRIVPARFPPISLFEDVAASPDDLDALNELEGATSARLREEAGEIHLIRPEDRRFGNGYSPVMAAFTYPAPSRFSDGAFGVYYCAKHERTAVAETRYHRERFLRESSEPPMALEMRVYIAEVRAPLLDLRIDPALTAPYLHRDDWGPSQRLGARARQSGCHGLVYPSVRDSDHGECGALLRPPAVGPTRQGKHFEYRWDGERISQIVELRSTPY